MAAARGVRRLVLRTRPGKANSASSLAPAPDRSAHAGRLRCHHPASRRRRQKLAPPAPRRSLRRRRTRVPRLWRAISITPAGFQTIAPGKPDRAPPGVTRPNNSTPLLRLGGEGAGGEEAIPAGQASCFSLGRRYQPRSLGRAAHREKHDPCSGPMMASPASDGLPRRILLRSGAAPFRLRLLFGSTPRTLRFAKPARQA